MRRTGGKAPINKDKMNDPAAKAALEAIIPMGYAGEPDVVANADAWLYGSLSGACWAFGQFFQYRAYRQIGVSQALPISTGLQLAGTSLVGVLLLGEWPAAHERLIGAAAVLTIIVGVHMTAWRENAADGGGLKARLITLAISTFGYDGYSYFPRVRDVVAGLVVAGGVLIGIIR